MKPDFGATADDYRKHRAGFPDSRLLAQARELDGAAGAEVDYWIGPAEEASCS